MFHYTFPSDVDSILKDGLWKGSLATPDGTMSPLQAQMDLSLDPYRGLRGSLLRIDLAGMREAGFAIPEATRVQRKGEGPMGDYEMPGGGFEMKFPYRVPREFITIVR